MGDPWPDYVSMVSGLSKATRARARAAAWALLSQAGLDELATDATERITRLADEITAASKANRELLENLVNAEVDKAATRLGFVRADDLSQIRADIVALRAQLTVVSAAAGGSTGTAPATGPASETTSKPTSATGTAAKKVATKATPATKAATKAAPAKNAATKAAPAKKTAAKAAPATKAAVKKAAVKKAGVKKAAVATVGPTTAGPELDT